MSKKSKPWPPARAVEAPFRRKYLSVVGGRRLFVDAMDGKTLWQWEAGDWDLIERASAPKGLGHYPLEIPWAKSNTKLVLPTGPGTPELDHQLWDIVQLAELPPGLTPADLVALLRAYVVVHVLRSSVPVRPILLCLGMPGSGKTSLARLIGWLLFGPEFNVNLLPGSDRDLEVVLAGSPFVVLDNVESIRDKALDCLCAVATGVKLSGRALYQNATEAPLEADVFIGMTTATGSWVRADLLDRCLPIRMRGPLGGTRIPESVFKRQALSARPAIWGEILTIAGAAFLLQGTLALPPSNDRLVDFREAGTAVSMAVGGQVEVDHFLKAFSSVRSRRASLMEESDPRIGALFELLQNGPMILTPSEWIDRIGQGVGATGAAPTTGDAHKWVITAFKELKAKTTGLVAWTLMPRVHGQPRRHRAELV